ncbi:serine/threonine-protein kinase [Nocardioides ultimimeridianus]
MSHRTSDDPPAIGGWQLHEQLGAGGMGTVWHGTKDGRHAAVKVVTAGYAADPEFRRRFRREIVISQLAESDRIAKVLEYDMDGPTPWLASTLLDGETLADQVRRRGPLSSEACSRLAAELAEAIAALDAAGIVHRDIKPSNVMMTSRGAVLVDLGIAQAADVASLTQTGARIGSPGWMAPEQVEGHRATGATDVFAWGLCVAFAATGTHPFGTGATDAVLLRIRNDPPSLDAVEPSWRPIVGAALGKDPATRPRPEQLVLPAPSTRPSAAPQPAAPTLLPGSHPASGSAPTAAATVPAYPAPMYPVPPAAPTRRGRARAVLGVAGVVVLLAIAGLLAVLVIRSNGSHAVAASGTTPSPHGGRHSSAASSPTSTSTSTSVSGVASTCVTRTPSTIGSWTRYATCRNPAAGYAIDVPTAMTGVADADPDEQRFVADDTRITLRVAKQANPGVTALTRQEREVRRLTVATGRAPSYSSGITDGTSFVVTGYEADGSIYYERAVVLSQAEYWYVWHYPASAKSALNAALQHELSSFVPGPDVPVS